MNPELPLYHRIETDIKNKILHGIYQPGTIIPSEKELTEIYNASRVTIREAVNRLVQQGLVEKKQGKGTFVKKPEINHKVGHLYNDGGEILKSHYDIKTKVLNLKIIKADADIVNQLNLSEQETDIVFLERLRYANKTPAAILTSYIPYKFVRGIESIDFTDISLYKTLREKFHIHLHEAEEVIEAIKSDERTSKLLSVPENTPLLLNHRVVYLIDKTPIEYETIVARSDVYKYKNHLKGVVSGTI